MDQLNRVKDQGPFFYKGSLEASKSLMNRGLIIQSFFPELELLGRSRCEDVEHLKKALENLKKGARSFDCGAGGTTFRFLLGRLSRLPGSFSLKGSQRLFSRPHEGLLQALRTLGCEFQWRDKSHLEISSQGWQGEFMVSMGEEESSQFISALVLSSWNLEKPLILKREKSFEKGTYLDMTLQLVKSLGMEWKIEPWQKGWRLLIPPAQRLWRKHYKLEPDMSSAFALTTFALFNGQVEFTDFPQTSLQPDSAFLSWVTQIGGQVHWFKNSVRIKGGGELQALQLDLGKTPDSFPLLAILLSRAQGTSLLKGLGVLVYKESDRLSKVQELLSQIGVKYHLKPEALMIHGCSSLCYPPCFEFSPDEDHRMAMAGALARFQGALIQILNPQVVSKSFPDFWKIINQTNIDVHKRP